MYNLPQTKLRLFNNAKNVAQTDASFGVGELVSIYFQVRFIAYTVQLVW